MKISRARIAVAGLLLAGAALPALGQDQDRPESLLPPGFDDPAPAPAPAPGRPATSPSSAPAGDEATTTGVASDPGAEPGNASETTAEPVDLSLYEMPDFARHTLDRVGVVAPGNAPFPADAFGRSDGPYLTTLMRRMNAPVASRWVSIALRRALMSRVATPRGANGADFAAERAWLLVRMGESVSARALVQDVDVEDYTPRMLRVAMQAQLAAADPGGLCPFSDVGAERLPERGWGYARAICAGLAGEPNRAGQLFDAARRGRPGSDIDTLLAEKVMGMGAQGRRAVTVEWQGVDRLSAWRWGLATAGGETVPPALYDGAGAQVRYWQALSPIPDPRARAASAELAAAQGVFSNAGLVDLYAEIEQLGETSTPEVAAARDLRTAYTGGDAAARLAAMRALWNEARGPRSRYGRYVLTAGAAARFAPSADLDASASDALIASMLTAGFDAAAMRWAPVARRASDGWAMLLLANPAPRETVSYADANAYSDAAKGRKAQMFVAAIAGLGRVNATDAARLAAGAGVQIGAANAWTRAIDAAARRGEEGTVTLLAAAGMQTRDWAAVSPEALFHIVAALRTAGLGNYARMVAVEAMARA